MSDSPVEVVAPWPYLPPKAINNLMGHFSDTVYRTDPGSHLFRFVEALVSDSGAGDLQKQYLIARMNSFREGNNFLELDVLFGSLLGIYRLDHERYPYNPATDMLSSDEWDEVTVKDMEYRARALDFLEACQRGGTEEGFARMVRSVTGAGADVYESWKYPGKTVGRSLVPINNEVIIRPDVGVLGDRDKRILLDSLNRIKPVGTVVTIDPLGVPIHTPVNYRNASADSSYFEIIKSVVGIPDLTKAPAPEYLAEEIFEGEKWLEEGGEAKTTAHNHQQEYSYYHRLREDGAGQIDSVKYYVESESLESSENSYRWAGVPYQSVSTKYVDGAEVAKNYAYNGRPADLSNWNVTSNDKISLVQDSGILAVRATPNNPYDNAYYLWSNDVKSQSGKWLVVTADVKGLDSWSADNFRFVIQSTSTEHRTNNPQRIISAPAGNGEYTTISASYRMIGNQGNIRIYFWPTNTTQHEKVGFQVKNVRYGIANTEGEAIAQTAEYFDGGMASHASLKLEENYVRVEEKELWEDWRPYPVADSPDNFPGGKGGQTPFQVPALTQDGQPYQFPYENQQELVDEIQAWVIENNGEVTEGGYRLPLQTKLVERVTYMPESVIPSSTPIAGNPVVTSWYGAVQENSQEEQVETEVYHF